MTSSRIAGSYGSPILIFLGTSILFFILTAPNYSPSDSAQRFHFSTALLTPVISSLCDNNYYNSCEMISNCFFLNWGTVSLQYFVSFCCTTKLITSLSFCLSLSTHTHTHTHTRVPSYLGLIPTISIPLIFREIQIKTIMRCHLTSVKMTIIKNLKIINAREKREPSYTVGDNVSWPSCYGEQYGDSLKKPKLGLPYALIPLLGIYSEETIIVVFICIWTWNNRLVPNWERSTSGYILSPCLFKLNAEYIMRNAGLDEAQAGIKIARRNINNLR